ncbi:hypothetical protein [Sulfurospirillum multivorans]|uniref:Highly acidic protein n=2 Tax=Sulfurospirillum multivorans TaxID=66821 RepID=A0AA86AJJ5_SULMK|nr:hypothetical protein [Sulfurospirillum multivorans]AHJ11841.1 hypothetical protein SMUL_0566 [Sulfurospirillum multivorans DSM 12446]QEH05347.1 hypothetical protein SMN_0564 [Sulfurospirillum multivorans]
MRLLLLNNNPAVSRLIKLSAEKAGYELDEFEDYGLVPLTTYDLILVDNELYDENALVALREHTDCDYVVYICQRGSKKPEAVNVVLEKPFLPTDFLVLLEKIKNVIESHKAEEVTEDPIATSSATTDAFDIDQIDTLEGEDDMLPINLLEEYDNDFKKEESSEQRDSFDDLERDDLNLDDNALEDKQSDLEEKELTLEDPFSFDAVDSLDKEAPTSFEDFDFEEEPSTVSSSLDEEEVHNPSILDKDDIDEVKQLLDESEEEEDEKEIDALSLDALGIEEDDAGTFFLDEEEKEEEEPLVKEEDSLALEADDMSDLTFEDVPPVEDEMEDALEKDTVVAEDQEEIIDDFAEVIEEKIEEEKEQALEEEEFLPSLDSALSGLDDALGEIDSLDDLNETMLKVAFGEEVEEEAEAPAPVATEAPKSQDIEVIRDEIENSIARSISSLAQSDILREALKGMRLNISITFDEK